MKRRFLSIAVIAVAVFLLSATAVSAQTWDCGASSNVGGASSVQCVLTANGTFTVSGTGAMANYSSPSFAPWHDLRNSITSLVIEEGVTTIGSLAFHQHSNLTGDLVIPNSVTTIGESAFSGCSGFTGSLTIGNSVTSIGGWAFSGCSGFTGIDSYMRDLTNISTSAFSSITNKPLTCDTDMSSAHQNLNFAIGNIFPRPFTPTLAIVGDVTQVSIGEAFTVSIDFGSAPLVGLTSDILTVINGTAGPLTYTGHIHNTNNRLPVENIVGTVAITPTGGYITAQIAENAFTFFGTGNSESNVITMSVEVATVAATPLTGVVSPVMDAVPSTNINDGIGFTAALVWDGAPTVFDHNTIYTATITLTAATGYTFAGAFANTDAIAEFTVNGIAPVWVSNNGAALVFKVTFPSTAIRTYTVTFVDHDDTELDIQTINHGSAATAPTSPTREGYDFTGWDVVFDNVTGNLIVTAQYSAIKTYTVAFVYQGTTQGTTLRVTVTVSHGSAATAPTPPARAGYDFTGWDVAFDNVTSNLTVTAQYAIKTYTVRFVDHDDTELDVQTIEHGSAATAPTPPARVGYDFTGWDVAFDNVTDNLTVTAQWTRMNIETPVITTQPVSTTVPIRAPHTFTVAADVNDGGVISYQWYSNTSASNAGGAPITGATGTSYSPSTLLGGVYYYYVVVTNTNEYATDSTTVSIASSVATLTIPAGNVWDGTIDTTWYTGTAAQTFNINTPEQLAGLAHLVNNRRITFRGQTISLGADIFLNDITGNTSENFDPADKRVWTPIGNNSNQFQGEFDGIAGIRNRRIYGLYIPNGGSYQGLFGYTTAIIRNLDLIVGTVIGTGDNVGAFVGYGADLINVNSDVVVSGRDYVGGLAGSATSIQQNSYSTGNISGRDYVGGLAGWVSTTQGGVITITTSYSTGNISGRDYVGGLAGRMFTTQGGVTTITTSYANGNVSGRNFVGGLVGMTSGDITSSNFANGSVTGQNRVGGLVGSTSGSVTSSYTVGSVTGVDTVGGLVGNATSAIRNSYALESVTGRNAVGGLTGHSSGPISGSHTVGDVTGRFEVGGLAGSRGGSNTIDSCYSHSKITGMDDNVGGLVGSLRGTIQNSFATGNVTGVIDTSTSAGNDNLGGLVGYSYGGSVLRSFASGNVTGTARIGGLVGRADGTTISNSYALGDVTADGDGVSGGYYAGGLVGVSGGSAASSFTDSYSSGAVSSVIQNYVGGFVGANVGTGTLTFTRCHYDATSSRQAAGVGDPTSTTGLTGNTTANMWLAATFAGWNWSTWGIEEGTNYPHLLWQNSAMARAVVTTTALTDLIYTGAPIEPAVISVTLNGEPIDASGYTVEYANNINAGTAVIIVRGTGTYVGTQAIKFTINAITNAETPTISTQPSDDTVTVGTIGTILSVSASVSDGGVFSYQWYSNTTASNAGGMAIDDATASTYSPSTTTAGTFYYYVVVTNTNSSVNGNTTATITSDVVMLVVLDPPPPPPPPTYTLTVQNGGLGFEGNGVYKAGDTVVISSGLPAENMRFLRWTSTGFNIPASVVNVGKTTIIMPSSNVTLTANWEAVTAARVNFTFAAGSNIVNKASLGKVAFFVSDSGASLSKSAAKLRVSGTIIIYDAMGNVVRRLNVKSSDRLVAEWDLKDSKGRLVADGTYLARGMITVNGKREKVSAKIAVR